MKFSSLTFFTAGIVAVGLGGCSSGPVTEVGPFSETETAYIRSEDGNFTIVKAVLKDGNFIESDHGKTSFEGKVSKDKEGAFTVLSEDGKTLDCKKSNSKTAICGSIRYRKAKGQFQFDRKIPFYITETIVPLRAGELGGTANRNATVMFKSEDDSIWIASEKSGTFKFVAPDKFKIDWTTYPIWTGAKSGYVFDKRKRRKADCTFINTDKGEVIVCRGAIDGNAYSTYSASWQFIDNDDQEELKD